MREVDIDPARCSGILKKLPLFHGLLRSDFEKLSHVFKAVQMDDGQMIFNEGEHSKHMYVLLAGKVQIVRRTGGVLYELLPGEIFGEIGMVSQRLRTASAKALGPITLLAMSRDDFNRILGQAPMIASMLLRNITIALSSHLIRMNDQVLEYVESYDAFTAKDSH